MNQFVIKGSNKLTGDVFISGSKNASLPILFATILSEEEIEIQNVPKIKDTDFAIKLLRYLGATVEENKSIYINAKNISIYHAPCNLVKTMRASIWALGPLLARFGEGSISLPGGCEIGNRPVDLHLYGLKKLGAKIYLKDGYVKANVKGRLHSARIVMNKISVGATLTIMSAATLAIGITIIENAAREPEIIDTANFLISLGAKINGVGTNTIFIKGVKKLKGGVYKILPDRIETGTFLVAAAISRGKITCYDTNPNTLNIVLKKLHESGARIEIGKDWIKLDMIDKRPKAVKIETSPYPGFPTDMQAQFTVLNLISYGSSIITENIFENRFMHISELIKMGGRAIIKNNNIFCYGVNQLFGAQVIAKDLRTAASLIIAGCIADGITTVDCLYHIDRGYCQIENKLKNIGANIKRLKK
ncbi:murA [Wigglesworthia glossinidia endosymbiont of Glossina brevipalpis]|uniref:UDP-N-acetylglucosamine 1-carboxyvinyltransferase n=1 Tax=Wigglesworthia glossinidia brevipalpis TaxID=36870 RepID=MURA_WIGBR|nr:RecName: Full=UDP-N-acetylglucosamine 1-carboxyvinyltransferase; AltName: Full=Enoylpyruvate transferase; AltName: Full=UDP-N-acetylglucosamine enolpyruvyl transferase; Short=EPT [Wigglesworthia glossinidia endosymbiont of Glossina brevipalpis]BAC24475.1 murA [Wigglesworthia glossinidia endosymbiont of Glossina brevipalpis]